MTQRVALVTGAMGGIGTAMCKALARAGFKVVANYMEGIDKKDEWLAAMAADGFKDIVAAPGDVSKWDDMVAMAQQVGPVDVIVNNAGITKDAMFKKMTKEQWDAVININLNSVFNVTRQFWEGMLERNWGRVINISSVNGQKGQAGQTNYSAAKAAMHGFTMALAQECASKGITVNTISPGYIGTAMVKAIREDVLQKIVDGVPMKRLGEPEEIGDLVAYLASDSAAFITGANMAINGGLHMQ